MTTNEADAIVTGEPAGSIPDAFGGARRPRAGDAVLVELAAAGASAGGEYRCSDCGYGAIVHHDLPPCPMCGGAVWESSVWAGPRPLAAERIR